MDYALKGMNGVMPVIVRTADSPYRWKVAPAPLADIANHEKKMPRGFISRDGPGSNTTIRPSCSMSMPGALPFGLSSTDAPSMTIA